MKLTALVSSVDLQPGTRPDESGSAKLEVVACAGCHGDEALEPFADWAGTMSDGMHVDVCE